MAVSHRASLRLHVVLPSGEERLVLADYASTATVRQLGEALRDHYRLPPEPCDVCVMGANAVLSADAALDSVQLLHGQSLYVLPTRNQGTLPASPYLSALDRLRLVHESGPQLGLAWPLRASEVVGLRLNDDHMLVPSDGAEEGDALEAALTADGRAAIVTLVSEEIELQINGWSASGTVEVRPGSLLQLCLMGARGQIIDIRLMTRGEHDSTRNRHGMVVYRVRPHVDTPADLKPLSLRLESEPRMTIRPLDLIDVALQDGSMFLIYLLLVLRGGLQAWSFFFLLVPTARVGYRFYRHQRDQDETVAEHRAWQARTEQELGVLRSWAQREAEAVTRRHPTLELLAEAARSRGPLLWQLRLGDVAALTHTLGLGEFRASSDVVVPGGLTEGDKQDWRAYIERLKIVPDAPIEMSLLDHNLGILGPRDVLYGTLRDTLLRLLLIYSPAYLAVGALLPLDSDEVGELGWLSWLPHMQSPTSLFAGTRLRRGPDDSRRAIAESLQYLKDKPAGAEHLLLIVHEAAGVDVGMLQPFVKAGEGRVHVVWIGASRSLLPAIIDTWLEIRAKGKAFLYPHQKELAVKEATRTLADQLGRSLAGLVDEGSSTVSAAIPQVVSLGSICSPAFEAGALVASESLIAAVGEGSAALVEIDLVQQGPHLLIGGTTGSGKSELVRSLLLSLACRYASRELAMLLIDYKGGASLDQLRALPHCIGMVSNLGEDDVQRLISFLNAELARRQAILKDFQGEYSRYRRARNRGLPRLVVVIDEFGGFASQQGNDKREAAILNIAARGRSLGVHLILATQTPKGVVSSAIRANVNARLCLRTLDEEDSLAVLGEAHAARLPRSLPGRCFARLDTGQLVQFQSAWTGSKTLLERDDEEPVSLRDLDLTGPISDEARRSLNSDAPTDAETVIATVGSREARADDALTEIDQPKLSKRLEDYEDVEMVAPGLMPGSRAQLTFRVGLRDDPGHQTQRAEELDLRAGSVLLSGGSASGRTTALVNAVRQFREAEPESQVVLVDCAGGDLKIRGGLPMMFSWIIDEGFQANLAHLIEQLFVESPDQAAVPVFVVIDRLDLCQDALGGNLPALARVVASGGRRGVCIVATADNRLPLEPELSKAFRFRYYLRDDQSHIMTDAEGALIRAYLPRPPREGEILLGMSSTPRSRRPLGFMSAAEIDRVIATYEQTGLLAGIDEVRHELVELRAKPGVAVTGPASSGKTSCLFSLCWWVATRTGNPVPIIAGYEIPPCDWLTDVCKLWRDSSPATPDDLMELLASTIAPDVPVLAVDDLDRLDLEIASLPISSNPTTVFRNKLAERIANQRIATLATGPIEILTGRTAVENRLSDALHATHQNFVVLQPLPEDVAADRGVFALYRRIAARPGRSYLPGSGIAMTRSGRHEIRTYMPDAVEDVLKRLPRNSATW